MEFDSKIGALVDTLDSLAKTIQSKISQPDSPDKEKLEKLLADYQTTVDVVKLLSDIRFRCLVFVTAIIAIANALIPGTGNPGTRIALGFVGLVATLGITIYDLRNSQLYDAAIHRAKDLERRLVLVSATKNWDEGGLFAERPPYVPGGKWKDLTFKQRKDEIKEKRLPLMRFWLFTVKHDHGLALIYGAALGGWVYLIADGFLALPPPKGLWGPAPVGWIPPVIAAIIGGIAFLTSYLRLKYHDANRYKPERRAD
jgi:hypothetical protein